MPAPIEESSGTDSNTRTAMPTWWRLRAVARPPTPAPTTMTFMVPMLPVPWPAMLTRGQNESICMTGPGTPGGELMRRYWQPVALAEELPIGGAPIPVELLSEKLVLFRDEHGAPALIVRRCPHRGADLSYGRVESGGLRCLYHGWVYSGDGRCLE